MAFKATDFLITPRDLWIMMRALLHLSFIGWVKLVALVGVFFLARHFGVEFTDDLFLTYFIGVFLYNIEARISISFALGLLVLIVIIMLAGPFTEFINETTWPEPIAVWVFYFLSIGVLKQMKDTFLEKDVTEDKESPVMQKERVNLSVQQVRSPAVRAIPQQRVEGDTGRTVVESYNKKYILIEDGGKLIIQRREPKGRVERRSR